MSEESDARIETQMQTINVGYRARMALETVGEAINKLYAEQFEALRTEVIWGKGEHSQEKVFKVACLLVAVEQVRSRLTGMVAEGQRAETDWEEKDS